MAEALSMHRPVVGVEERFPITTEMINKYPEAFSLRRWETAESAATKTRLHERSFIPAVLTLQMIGKTLVGFNEPLQKKILSFLPGKVAVTEGFVYSHMFLYGLPDDSRRSDLKMPMVVKPARCFASKVVVAMRDGVGGFLRAPSGEKLTYYVKSFCVCATDEVTGERKITRSSTGDNEIVYKVKSVNLTHATALKYLWVIDCPGVNKKSIADWNKLCLPKREDAEFPQYPEGFRDITKEKVDRQRVLTWL
jgi:hypothetical protein